MKLQKYLLALLIIAAMPLSADTLFNYDGFYARMKKSEQAVYADITLAFLVQRQGSSEACEVTAARITTDISDEPLHIAQNGELILPFLELYNNRKALIKLIQPADAAPCDLNFRLRSKLPLQQSMTLSQLLHIRTQFEALLEDLSGLGKYFLPKMTGVTLLFPDDAALAQAASKVAAQVVCQQHSCHLNLQPWIGQSITVDTANSILQFSTTPTYIVPLLQAQ